MALFHREKYIIVFFILLVLFLGFSSFLFLPAIDENAFRARTPVRDRANRAQAEMRDREALLEKVQRANIPPPAIQDEVFSKLIGFEAMFERREFIKNMTLFAWTNYRKYAWGSNELRPLSKTGHSASIFGKGELGATIVDSIDTLYIMGLMKEYDEARLWIDSSLDFRKARLFVYKFCLAGKPVKYGEPKPKL